MDATAHVQVLEYAAKYRLLELSPDESVTISLRHIMANITEHMQANLDAAQESDPEGIHQLRIGIRRARAALRMFRELLPRNSVRRFERRLRTYGTTLGEARDWDVFITETLSAPHIDEVPEVTTIRNRAISQQTRAHDQVKSMLPQLVTLTERMARWTDKVEIAETSIQKVAPDLLDGLAKQVKARRRKATLKDYNSLHRLRKSVKRLRYCMEFTSSLYDKKTVKRKLGLVKESLDLLGEMNDALVTQNLVAKLHVTDQQWDNKVQKARKRVPKALANLRMKSYW